MELQEAVENMDATQKNAESCFDIEHLYYQFSIENSVALMIRYSKHHGLRPSLRLVHVFY